MSARVRRCLGCGVLLTAGRPCTPCDTETVHVITTLGPTDGPGLTIRADLTGMPGAFRTYRYTPPSTSFFDPHPDPCPVEYCISRRGHVGRHPIARPTESL